MAVARVTVELGQAVSNPLRPVGYQVSWGAALAPGSTGEPLNPTHGLAVLSLLDMAEGLKILR